MKNKVYWHLPGLYMDNVLYYGLFPLLKEHAEYLRDGHEIHCVYGSIPFAVWNGGRKHLGDGGITKEMIIGLKKFYSDFNIKIALTWSNTLLKKEHLNDTYCNMITEIFEDEGNYIITASNLLFDHIKSRYPKYKIIASSVRHLPADNTYGLDRYYDDYDLIVLHHEFNKDIEQSEYLTTFMANKLELMVNQSCISWCQHSDDHYRSISQAQLNFSDAEEYKCPYKKKPISNPVIPDVYYNEDTFLSRERVEELSDIGIQHFKIVGRSMRTYDMITVLKWILYYMINDEYKNTVWNRLITEQHK